MSTCPRFSGIERINTRYSNQWKSHRKAVREYVEGFYRGTPKLIVHDGLYESYVFSGSKDIQKFDSLLRQYEKMSQHDLIFLRLIKQREFWLKTFTPAMQKAIKTLVTRTTEKPLSKQPVNALASKRAQRVSSQQPTLTLLGIPFQNKWVPKLPQKFRALVSFLMPLKD